MVLVSVMSFIVPDAWNPVWKLTMVKFVKGLSTNCSKPISYWTCLFIFCMFFFARHSFVCYTYHFMSHHLSVFVIELIMDCAIFVFGLSECWSLPIFLTFLLGPVYTGHFMHFWSGSYPNIKRPKCKCSEILSRRIWIRLLEPLQEGVWG